MAPLALCMELVRHHMASWALHDNCNAAMRCKTNLKEQVSGNHP